MIDTLSTKYDVTITSVDRSWVPGRVYFTGVSLRTRPEHAGDPITTFYIDKLELDLGILPLLHKTVSLDATAWVGPGKIKAHVSLPGMGKKGIDLDLSGKNLPGDLMPMRAVLGLPMTGKLDFAFTLDLPYLVAKSGRTSPDWKKAVGHASFGCPTGCSFGDGKTKLKPLLKNNTNQAQALMVGDGIEFGKVNIDSLSATAEIKKGKLDITKFDTSSKDGTLKVDFSMTLEPELDNSVVDGCLRFNGSQALAQREPRTYAAITASGADLRSDGLFHIKLMGELKEMRRLNMECGPHTAEHEAPTQHGEAPRPHITLMPDRPMHPPPGAAATPPPSPPATPSAPPSGQPDHALAPAMHPPPGPEGEVQAPAGSAAEPGSAADHPEDQPPPGAGTANAGGSPAGDPR
jgi:type II secretion system protein N